ncbi:MAG: hypothetical protein U0840_03020 [Gemmataceae bacterium]
MAFNPFTWFRKHQKVLFAGLTILCMVVFIGQFGAGDVFSRTLGWFGANRASGPVVTTLHGTKVREGELDRLVQQRRFANDFLFATTWDAHDRVCKTLLDERLKPTSTDNPLSGLREIVESARQRTGGNLIQTAFTFMRQGMSSPSPILRMQIEGELNRLEEIAAREKVRDNPENLAVVQQVATILGFQFWITEASRLNGAFGYFQSQRRVFPRDFYFGGGDKVDDLLDFRLWQLQADRLGIQLTDNDVRREVVAEAANGAVFEERVPFDSDRRVVEFLASQRAENLRFTARDLLNAVREEFRVVLAQGILLGSEPGVRAYRLVLGASTSPAVGTPDEFLNYFREQRTTLRYKFLKLPVASFLDQVKDKPTDTELRSRFDRYKDQEPVPTSRDPGFREPRRFLTEYAFASPADKFYVDAGRARLATWAVACAASGCPIETAALVLADPIRQEYDLDVKVNDPTWYYNPRDSLMMLEERARKLHYTSVIQPQPLRWLVGSLAATGGSPMVPLANLYGAATVEEVTTGVRFALTQLLASATPDTLFGSAALILQAMPEPTPYRLMEPQILATLIERYSEEELRKNMQALRDELNKLRGRAITPKEQEGIDALIKKFALAYKKMPAPMTRDAIAQALKKKQDLNLQPLVDAIMRVARFDRPDQVADALGMRVGTYEPDQFQVRDPRREDFVFWRSQDLPSRPRDYDKVRGDVETAWRMEKARQLARKEAERLEDEINKKKLTPADAARLLAEQKGETFELDSIAQFVPPREVLAGRRTEYTPYQVPEDRQGIFEYAPAELAKQLMTLKRPGEATVVVDQPARNFYVAVLMDRAEPTVAEFKALYEKTPRNDALYSMFLAQRRADFRKSVLEQLRREAGPVEKDGRFKVADSVRRRDSGQREEE